MKKAATARFNALDRDHDGTLDRRELGATVTAWQFKQADLDKDRTLDKNEYLALVEIDCAERMAMSPKAIWRVMLRPRGDHDHHYAAPVSHG